METIENKQLLIQFRSLRSELMDLLQNNRTNVGNLYFVIENGFVENFFGKTLSKYGTTEKMVDFFNKHNITTDKNGWYNYCDERILTQAIAYYQFMINQVKNGYCLVGRVAKNALHSYNELAYDACATYKENFKQSLISDNFKVVSPQIYLEHLLTSHLDLLKKKPVVSQTAKVNTSCEFTIDPIVVQPEQRRYYTVIGRNANGTAYNLGYTKRDLYIIDQEFDQYSTKEEQLEMLVPCGMFASEVTELSIMYLYQCTGEKELPILPHGAVEDMNHMEEMISAKADNLCFLIYFAAYFLKRDNYKPNQSNINEQARLVYSKVMQLMAVNDSNMRVSLMSEIFTSMNELIQEEITTYRAKRDLFVYMTKYSNPPLENLTYTSLAKKFSQQ